MCCCGKLAGEAQILLVDLTRTKLIPVKRVVRNELNYNQNYGGGWGGYNNYDQ